MATAASPAPPLKGVQPLRAGKGNSFFWRKLHSLTGIVPIGAFLIEHIVSNFETVMVDEKGGFEAAAIDTIVMTEDGLEMLSELPRGITKTL